MYVELKGKRCEIMSLANYDALQRCFEYHLMSHFFDTNLPAHASPSFFWLLTTSWLAYEIGLPVYSANKSQYGLVMFLPTVGGFEDLSRVMRNALSAMNSYFFCHGCSV